ncbi:MAG: D-amino-acid transaminase [Rhodospirillaceae bacterium]|nr:D-amino-acid transaminase [Rhodospirillaceae bacterium]
MPKIAFVNGSYRNIHKASIEIEDRGFQFADGVYEVIALTNEVLIDLDFHLDRLNRSLTEINIKWPMSRESVMAICAEVIRRNRLTQGSLYIQITRGVTARDFSYPNGMKPSLVIYGRRSRSNQTSSKVQGIKVISTRDIRWGRCDIKSISLLASVLAKTQANHKIAQEAWLLNEDGFVTEGASSNAWIVPRPNVIQTHPENSSILSGITRLRTIKLAQEKSIKVIERPFSINEAKKAKEAFLTSSTLFVQPIVDIDGSQIGDGKIGSTTKTLIKSYSDFMD